MIFEASVTNLAGISPVITIVLQIKLPHGEWYSLHALSSFTIDGVKWAEVNVPGCIYKTRAICHLSGVVTSLAWSAYLGDWRLGGANVG